MSDPPRRVRPIVAIDGPAGAGKSTVARRLADALGFVLVDTGAIYRAVALAAKGAGIPWDDATRVGDLARSLVARRAMVLEQDAKTGVRVRLDGNDVTDAIRAADMGMGASTVSAHPDVRTALLDMQRQAGNAGAVVLEGRDIGTVVFPDADVKFFLTARPEVRARRRFDELVAKGAQVTFDATLADVRRRDEQDTTRPVAPLRQAADATTIDNSDIGIDETVFRMVQGVRAREQPVTRIAFALAACLVGSPPVLGCASTTAAPPPHARYTEPRWQDAFGDTPELLVVVRPKALKQDKLYGPLLRWGIERLREHFRGASAIPLEAIENAEEFVIGVHPKAHADDQAAPDFAIVVVGVRADIDPAALVDASGRALWSPGPGGALRELVLERDEHGLPVGASLFELPGRSWIMVSGEGRARARDAFAHPLDRPGMDLDPEALATIRIDGPSFVARVRALQTLGAYAAIGRRLKALNLRLPPGARGEVQLALAYADEDAAAFAEVTAREVIDAIGRQKPDKLAWLSTATVDRSAKRVVLKAPLPGSLIEVLMRAGGSAGIDLPAPPGPRGPGPGGPGQ